MARHLVTLEREVHFLDAVPIGTGAKGIFGAGRAAAEQDAITWRHGQTSYSLRGLRPQDPLLTHPREVKTTSGVVSSPNGNSGCDDNPSFHLVAKRLPRSFSPEVVFTSFDGESGRRLRVPVGQRFE